MTDPKPEVRTIAAIFAEAEKVLNNNKALSWTLGQEATKAALQSIDSIEGQEFINDYLLKILSMMTQQSPAKLGPTEKTTVEEAIMISLKISIKLLNKYPNLLGLLARAFDPKIPYYHGTKAGYNWNPGFPQFRIQAAKKFHELKGFHIVAEVLKKPDWPGSEAVLILLNMVNSQEMGIDDRLKEVYILVIMERLLSLPDELLKKENTDTIGNLINIVGAIHGNISTASNKNYRFQEPFYQFWFKMILKFMNSSSLVIKLFGWEQINEMIVEIKGIRPLPGTFTVEGAGTEYLNGVYNSTTRNPEAENFQYTKVSAQPGVPLLTLFRCTMRNTKAKWWFISQADLEKPGTDKDIDYYLHKSSPDDEREPPAFGWTRNNPGMNLIGVDPAPILKRGNVILPKGYTREMCIDMKFLDWTAAENILSLVFTSSVHRETVSRTLKYLLFLAEYEALSIDHLRLIWKSGIHSSDHDVMEEIFHILVQLTPFLNAPQFSFLMDLALENMKNDDLFPKVMRFVEKFSSEDYKYASAIHAPEMQEKFLSLLWTIYMHPETESLKSSAILQDLLSFCFKKKGGKDVAFEKINESRDQLREIATSEIVAESNISRIVQTLSFLISRFNGGGGLAEEFHRLDLVEPIVNEILRFMRSNRINISNDERWYISQLYSRFQVLRKYFAISNCEDLTVIHHLWNVARENTVDLNEFFVFLKGDNTNTVEPIFSNVHMLNVFTDIICSQDIDWSGCGEGAFECFRSYASELETYAAYFPMGTELPPKLGLSTLWRIVLSISSEKSQREATDLLLQSYDAMFQKQSEIQNEFLKIIFDDLQEFLDKLKSNMETSNARAERSIYILTAAVHKFGASSGIAHAARSCTSRLTLSIYYRRTYYHHSQQPHLDPMRIDKGSDGVIKIEVHPFHTVKLLKAKIADVIKSCQASNITLDNQFQRAFHDNTRLYELGVYEGQELSVSYQVSYQRQYDDELYGGYPYNKSDEYNFAQLLSEDYSKFDCLLSLCQESSNNEVLARIWELLMLLPTQPDLMDMIQSTTNAFDSDLLNESSTDKSWEQIFDADNVNPARKAYLLQIIDSLLRPAPEVDPKELNYSFRSNFLRSEGLQLILKSFLSTPTDSDIISFTTLAVCLNVLFFLVFDQSTTETGEIVSTVNDECLQSLTNMEDERTSRLLEKLLYVAHNAAAKENSSVVHSALVIITLLIRTPAVASQLIGNDYSKALLGTVLRSSAKKVREIASDFAVQVGKAQPVVFTWLLQDLEKLPPNDELCSELFHGLSFLLLESKYRNSEVDQAERKQLGKILSTKLVNYPRISTTSSEEKYDLLGYLQLMNQLINIDAQAVLDTEIGPGLIKILLSEFLFVLDPSSESNSLCDTSSTRRAAFGILSFLVKYDHSKFEEVLTELNKFAQQAGKHMHYHWGLQVSHDIKKSDIKFTGLKNQGCTCYSNSVLQTLFMTPKFRDAILGTPLRESHRSTLWHRKPEDLVDMSLLFELLNGSWRVGKVVAYDGETTWHTIHYLRNDGSLEEAAVFNIHEGRYGKESGRVRVLPEEGQEPLTEREEGAFRVLEQLQRTFCFLKLSKRKYFDPRPLVEACKTLNLNFNVYHQNDATEFYDQLLDRIETATKGKHTKKDMWNDVFLKEVFGGKWLTQKIPMDCDAFNKERDSCGHWQSSRVEDYLKVELIVRGKEKIDDSLDGLVQGELMDGDNKIQCEVCAQKKATTRRTCFGSLPNTLILHLKRFDLDFQTFETVKLNSKMTFPNVINMLKYTKEGIDISEAEKAISPSQGTSKELSYQAEHPSSIDPSDFDYELQGVLVHAGVAQGGHYYSFVRDGDDKARWFRFDDEDVTPFNPDNIPVQCFGGSSGNQSNSHHMIDDDRTANALMLFYTKVKKTEVQDEILVSESIDATQQEQKQELPPSDLVDGLQAFQAEVMQSNLQHLLTCYLVDPELHNFVRGLISAVSNVPLTASYDDEPAFTNIPLQWSPTEIEDDLPLRTVKFGSEFLLNVALHCRERPAVRSSIMVMKGMFEKYPHTAYWFVLNVLTVSTNTWLNDYLVSCNDALARATFVQLFVHAVNVIAPKDPQAVVACNSIPSNEIRKAAIENAAALCWLLVRSLFDLTLRSVGFSRNADEIYVLIRDLASIPALCTAFKTVGMVSFLSYFIMPDQVPVIIRNLYEKYMTPKQQQQQQQQNYRVEYTHLLQSVFEAIAALLGVPQIRKVNLLHEKSYWESELIAEAKDAFTQIFNEVSRNGVMETLEATQYLERVSGSTNSKNTAVLVRSMLDRFGSHLDGKLYLDGFLQYQADVASYNPKQVWRDLHAFGYRNDLSRNLPRNSPAANSNSVDEVQNQARAENLADSILNGLTENCRQCLSNIAFYESGLVSCEPAARAIAQRICFQDIDASSSLIHQALSRLHVVIQDNTWSHHPVSLINDFLRFLLNIDDGLQTNRFHVILFSKFGLASMALSEKDHPSNCRANEYNKTYLFERYITFIQDLVQVKGILDCLTRLAKEDPKVKTIKGMLRLRPGSNLTDSEDALVRNTIVILENAGVPEVNGEYHFVDLKNHAGYYSRTGPYREKDAKFTLYKCSLRNGGFQWFVSITPENMEPGTTSDMDFYYAPAKTHDYLPPAQWTRLNANHTRDPAPKVRFTKKENSDEDGFIDDEPLEPTLPNDSDSDREFDRILDDSNTSFDQGGNFV